jgi:invasion protein IalB
VLRRVCGAERKEVTGGWRNVCNEELHDLCCSLNVVRVIRARRMRWAGHVASAGDKGNAYRIVVAKPEGKRLSMLGNLNVDGRIIFKSILKM